MLKGGWNIIKNIFGVSENLPIVITKELPESVHIKPYLYSEQITGEPERIKVLLNPESISKNIEIPTAESIAIKDLDITNKIESEKEAIIKKIGIPKNILENPLDNMNFINKKIYQYATKLQKEVYENSNELYKSTLEGYMSHYDITYEDALKKYHDNLILAIKGGLGLIGAVTVGGATIAGLSTYGIVKKIKSDKDSEEQSRKK